MRKIKKGQSLVFDANRGAWIRIVPSRGEGSEREHQEPERREEPTAKEWEDALNKRNVALVNKTEAEVDAKSEFLIGDGTRPNKFTIQYTMPIELPREESGIVLRVGLADIRSFQKLVATPPLGGFLATVVEGYKGAKFFRRQIPIPVIGRALQLRGDFVSVEIESAIGTTDLLNISASLTPGKVVESKETRQRVGNIAAPILEGTVAYGVSVPGVGVALGDVIQERDPSGAIVKTYPAREGGIWFVSNTGSGLTYSPAAGAPPNVVWSFYLQK